MEQEVNFPASKQNTLHLLITNRPSLLTDFAILFKLICQLIKRKIHNWKRANLEELEKNVKEQMAKCACGNTISNTMNHLFSLTIKHFQERFVPGRRSSTH